MSGPNDVDRLLREWEDVASTAKPPSRDPRRSVQSAGAFPASMLLVAAIAVAAVVIVGRGVPQPTNPGAEPPSGEAPLSSDAIVEPVSAVPAASPSVDPASPRPSPSLEIALSDRGVADDGRFRVELTANGTTFEEGETIPAGAEVTFLGPEGSLATGHGSPAVTFAVEEIGGAHRSAAGGYDAMCLRSTFTRDEAVPFPWQRGGSWSSDDPSPNDRFTESYVAGWNGAGEGELRLPAGTWRLSAELDVDEGDCGGPGEPRVASIVIRVDPATGTATSEPEPPVLEVGPVVVCDRVSPEDCEHALALVRHQFDGGRDLYPGADIVLVADTCPPNTECDRQFPFEVSVVYATWPTQSRADDPALMIHTDSATLVQGMNGPEEALVGEGFVAPWMHEQIQTASHLVPVPIFPPQLPDEPRECPAALITGTLEEMATYGMGLEVDGEAWPVQWPFAFTARRDDGQLVLLDGAGQVVGGHGDPIQAGGGFGPTHVLACGAVIRAPAQQTP